MAEVKPILSFFNIKYLEQLFINACSNNDLITIKKVLGILGYKKEKSIIKRLINASKLKYLKVVYKKNILDSFLIKSCQNNNVEFVRYLISSEELGVHPSEKAQSENSLRWSLGSLDLVRYLITSEDLKKKPDIHFGNDFLFRHSCYVENKQMLQFLIFECDIQKTENIIEYLDEHPSAEAEKLFRLRSLKLSLIEDLKINSSINKKNIKI